MQIRCCINFIELKFVVVDWLRLLICFYVVFRSNASSSSTYLEAQLDFRWVFFAASFGGSDQDDTEN